MTKNTDLDKNTKVNIMYTTSQMSLYTFIVIHGM